MPNSLILLSNAATASSQLQQQISSHDKALFVVLGATPNHRTLADAAATVSVAFQHAILVTNRASVQPLLTAMNITVNPPFADFSDWFACCISINGEIVEIYTDSDQDNIVPCFLLASN